MLRAIINDRAALELPPEPIRLLVQSIQDDEDGEHARITATAGDGPAELHMVRTGGTFQVGARTFRVEGMHDAGHTASVSITQTA